MTEFDLTPPKEPAPLLDRLAEWDVQLKYEKEQGWYLTNTVNDDGWGGVYTVALTEEDADKYLTYRDREAAANIINGLDADQIIIDQEMWEHKFGYYSNDGMGGPSWNVKLHDTWGYWQKLSKALDFEFPEEWEIDREYTIWADVIDWEWDWFKGWIKEEWPDLDHERFVRLGRSGGHLVYNVRGGYHDEPLLTLAEAEALQRLGKHIPDMVRGVAQDMVAAYASHALCEEAERQVDKWEAREEKAKAKAIRDGDFEKAAWHQENIDDWRNSHLDDFEHYTIRDEINTVFWNLEKEESSTS